MSNRQDKVQILAELHLGMEEAEIIKSLLVTKQAVQLNSFLSFHREEEGLWLKSRSLWLQVGDKNNTFSIDNEELNYLEITSRKSIQARVKSLKDTHNYNRLQKCIFSICFKRMTSLMKK